jgi:hypothetical protein
MSTLSKARDLFSFGPEINDGNSGTTKTIDFTLGRAHHVTMDNACTFTFTAPVAPELLLIRFTQDGTGTRVATLPTIKRIGGAAIVLTVTAAAEDRLVLWYDGSVYWEVVRGLAYA